jgi:hypothetical protein
VNYVMGRVRKINVENRESEMACCLSGYLGDLLFLSLSLLSSLRLIGHWVSPSRLFWPVTLGKQTVTAIAYSVDGRQGRKAFAVLGNEWPSSCKSNEQIEIVTMGHGILTVMTFCNLPDL